MAKPRSFIILFDLLLLPSGANRNSGLGSLNQKYFLVYFQKSKTIYIQKYILKGPTYFGQKCFRLNFYLPSNGIQCRLCHFPFEKAENVRPLTERVNCHSTARRYPYCRINFAILENI